MRLVLALLALPLAGCVVGGTLRMEDPPMSLAEETTLSGQYAIP